MVGNERGALHLSLARSFEIGPVSVGSIGVGLAVLLTACSFTGPSSEDRADASPPPIDVAVDVAVEIDAAPERPFKSCQQLLNDDPATVTVAQGQDLGAIIQMATEGAIVEFSGIHDINQTIVMSADNVTVRGSTTSNGVINFGTGVVGFDVVASDVTLTNFEITGGGRQVVVSGNGANDASGFLAYNMKFTQPEFTGFESRLYSVHHAEALSGAADLGVVACSIFESPISDCAFVRGVLLDAGDDWRFTKNQFLNYDCSNQTYAMHVHSTRNPLIDRNRFDGYFVALRLGSYSEPTIGNCSGGGAGNVLDAVVCSNAFYGDGALPTTGVDFVQACDASAAHNTLFSAMPGRAFNAAFGTVLTLANNISNIEPAVGGNGELSTDLFSTNQFSADLSAFDDPSNGRLEPIVGATEEGVDISARTELDVGCEFDIVSRKRSLSAPVFVGAYEAPRSTTQSSP